MDRIRELLNKFDAEVLRQDISASPGELTSYEMCKDFQKEGAVFLSTRRYGLIADSVGLGKTPQSIAAMDLIGAQNAMILCPGVARSKWARELLKFHSKLSKGRVHIIKSSRQFREVKQGDTVITSYSLGVKAPDYLKFRVTILDEAHLVKNRMTSRTELTLFPQLFRAGTKARKNPVPCVFERSERVWALTATPTPNSPMEIYALSKAFKAHTMSKWHFINHWCTSSPGSFGKVEIHGIRKDKKEEFAHFIASFCLRRTKDQVGVDLPPLVYHDIEVTCKFSKEEKAQSDEKASRIANIDLLLKEAVHMATLRKLYGLKKVDGIGKYLRESHQENLFKKTIVFAHHVDVILGLNKELKDLNPIMIYGGTKKGADDKAIDAFQNDPNCRVAIVSLMKGSTAIDLYAADSVVYAELDWVPGNNTQALGRAHRMGQTNDFVNVVFVTLADCELDIAITDKLREKSELIDSYLKRDEVSDLKF